MVCMMRMIFKSFVERFGVLFVSCAASVSLLGQRLGCHPILLCVDVAFFHGLALICSAPCLSFVLLDLRTCQQCHFRLAPFSYGTSASTLDEFVVKDTISMLDSTSYLVGLFHQATQRLTKTDNPGYKLRLLSQRSHDSRAYENPDLFITFTCNTNWPEIRRELRKERVYKHEDKPNVNSNVSAEIPDKNVDPLCYDIIYKRVCSRVVYPTFQLTCRALGLLALGDDKEWSEAFCKAIATTMSPQLVQLFVSVILFCEVVRPLVLFTQFWHSMHDDDDILYKLRTCFRMPTDDHLKDCVLLELEAPINNKQENQTSLALLRPYSISTKRFLRILLHKHHYDQLPAEVQHLPASRNDVRSIKEQKMKTEKQSKKFFVWMHNCQEFLWFLRPQLSL
ncbi:hypothetical protein Peur_046453 [Populus x canadensis]